MSEENKTIMPMQPIVNCRFVENRIVSTLLTKCGEHGFTMNEIVVMSHDGKFTQQEQIQFAQLIGYSVSGFGYLSYVDDETYGAAARMEECGTTETESRNQELRNQIGEAREGIRRAAGALFRIHPDDLNE